MKFREIENWDRNSDENKKLGIWCDVVLTLSGEVFWRRAFASTKTTKRWIINLLEAKNWCETIIYECSLIKFSRPESDDLKIESKLLTFFQYEPIVRRSAKSHNNQQGTVGIESSILDMNLILMSTNVSFFPCFNSVITSNELRYRHTSQLFKRQFPFHFATQANWLSGNSMINWSEREGTRTKKKTQIIRTSDSDKSSRSSESFVSPSRCDRTNKH